MSNAGPAPVDVSKIFRNPSTPMFSSNFGCDNNPPRNPRGRPIDMHREVNSYGLIDNCYYTTLAGILGTTVEALTDQTEFWQERNGANLEHIETLYRTARLPIHQLYAFDNVQELEVFLTRANIGSDIVALPFAYQISPSMNHMVALYVRRDPTTKRIDGRLVDYQLKATDPRRVVSQIPASPQYFIFDTVRLFPSMYDT